MRRWFLLFLIILWPLFGWAQGVDIEDEDDEEDGYEETLVVGMADDYPPFEFLRDGKLVGYDVDMAKGFAKEMRMKLKIQPLKFQDLIPAVASGRVDCAISAITPTPERCAFVSFTRAYFKAEAVFVIPSTSHIMELADLECYGPFILGAQVGSLMETWADKIKAGCPHVRIHVESTPQALIDALKEKRVSGLILEADQATHYIRDRKFRVIQLAQTQSKYSVALRNQSPLMNRIEKALTTLIRQGYIDILYEKWLIRKKL